MNVESLSARTSQKSECCYDLTSSDSLRRLAGGAQISG